MIEHFQDVLRWSLQKDTQADFSSSLSLKLHSPPPCDEVRLNTH